MVQRKKLSVASNQCDEDWLELVLDDKMKELKIVQLLRPMQPTDVAMLQLMEVFDREIRLGLSNNPERRALSNLAMETSFISERLNGTETIDCLAMDLGGTRFRVLYVSIVNGKLREEATKVEPFDIPEWIFVASGEQLFDFLAECLHNFMRKNRLLDDVAGGAPPRRWPLGFTFSFPMRLDGLRSGILINWTKRFKVDGVEGRDVVAMLQDAIDRRGDMLVDVVCVLNDAPGTLMAGTMQDARCQIGLILASGCNTCYMEKWSRIRKYDPESLDKPGEALPSQREGDVIVAIESGFFGDNGSLDFARSEFDIALDKQSAHPGRTTFEKMVSGVYMGELTRLILERLYDDKLLFDAPRNFGQHTSSRTPANIECEPFARLKKSNGFPSVFISDVESDDTDHLLITEKVLLSMGIDGPSDDDLRIIQYVCNIVSVRAAKMVAAKVAQLIKRVNDYEMPTSNTVGVAVTGSLYEKHPYMSLYIDKFLERYIPGQPFKMILVRDGSGEGAALVAAVAERLTPPSAHRLRSRSMLLQQHANGENGNAEAGVLPTAVKKRIAAFRGRILSHSDRKRATNARMLGL